MNLIALEEKREEIKQRINEKKSLNSNYLKNMKEISDKIENVRQELKMVETKKEEINNNFRENLHKLNILKDKINEYKEAERNKENERIKKKIREKINDINQLRFTVNFSIFNDFNKLREFRNEIVLQSFVYDIFNEKKEELKEKIYEIVDSLILIPNKMNEVFYYLRFMKKCEEYFNDSFVIDYFFRRISDKFTYHFMTEKETNRLDKPEWIFKFIKEEINNIYRIFLILDIKLSSFLLMIEELLIIKIREIFITKSDQKRKLLWHFLDEYLIYAHDMNELCTNEGYKPELKEICKIILEVEEEVVNKRMNEIYSLKHNKWFNEFKKITNEEFQFTKRYSKILSDSINILIYLMSKIQNSYEMFVDELRYSSNDEIVFLCNIYTQIEQYKIYLQQEENDLLIVNCKLNFNILQKAKNNLYIFNQQNFKVIKELFLDEINKLNKKIKNFNFTENNELIGYVIDLSAVLSLYKNCSSFNILKEQSKLLIDTFIYENIIIKLRLSSEECFKLKDLIKRLNELFNSTLNLSANGLECLENIFEEKFYAKDEVLFYKLKELYD